MMNAEDRIGGSGDPVLERRFLEILDPVEPRRHPVAAGRHLARNFRVSAFARVHQTTILEIGEPNRGEDEQQDDGSAAGQRGRRGGDSRSGGRGHRDGRDLTAFRKLRASHTSLAAAPVIRYHAACRYRVAALAAPYAALLRIVVVYCAAFDHQPDVTRVKLEP